MDPSIWLQVASQLLEEQRVDAERFEKRYQDLACKFYQAQATYHAAAAHAHLQVVVQAKQAAIRTLLPYYPHPISPELRYQIDLT